MKDYSFGSKNTDNSNVNNVFKTSGILSEVIEKYIISHEAAKTSLICQYTKQIESISMRIYAYDKTNKLIGVYLIKERGKLSYSSLIKLPSKCENVNIVINAINGVLRKEMKDRRSTFIQLKRILMLKTSFLLFVLYPTTYFTAKIVGGNFVVYYIASQWLLISISLIISLCLAYYLYVLQWLKNEFVH